MGRQGPCYHCGVTSTPLWRNGPPEKPVLCNACGSRWRTKGNLANYMPLQARLDRDDAEDHKISKSRTAFTKNNEKAKGLKRNFEADNIRFTEVHPEYHKRACHKGLDDDATNRSSSGSVISNAETCAQYGCTDIGSSEPLVWDTMMASRKRACVIRPKQSPVEKLTKDLHTILHDQRSSSCYESSEEDLLFVESYKEMTSVETGHGSVLIQHPSSIIPCDEDSEASSISTCYKNSNLDSRKDRDDKLEKLQIPSDRSSPLCYIDTKDSKGKGIVIDSAVVSAESSFAIATISSMYRQRSSSRDVKQQSLSSSAGNVSALICGDKEVITVEENILPFDKNGLSLWNNGDDEDLLEHDLLLDLPYNGSFMEAELLQSSESRGSINR